MKKIKANAKTSIEISNQETFNSKYHNAQNVDVSDQYAKIYREHFKVMADWDLLLGKLGNLDDERQKEFYKLQTEFDRAFDAIDRAIKKKHGDTRIKESSSLKKFEKLSKDHNVTCEKFDNAILQELAIISASTVYNSPHKTSKTRCKSSKTKILKSEKKLGNTNTSL